MGRAAFPTGEVTFLFSDIEGSTQRWEAHTEAMKAAVARHEQLLRNAIERHGGYVFKLMGDAFCVAFHSVQDAVAAAVDGQRALAQEDFSSVGGLRVRMGLHTGQAEERDADYFGPAVNRVARLMSLGHGGQVLLSGAAHVFASGGLPPGVTLLDLRTHRLKDLTEPERVWQLTIEGMPAVFPPLKSLDAQPNNLPFQRTALIGRERDLEAVKSTLEQHRLLTLFGAGGVGKTRLALQAGADLLDRYPDGVWFADLAPIGDRELVASVVAKVVGMPQRGGERTEEAIPRWLERKHLLLILDNCEHVLEAVAPLADAILAKAPAVRLLSTSRQAIGISGEKALRVGSLDVPDNRADLTPSAALHYGAVALFVDRASLVDSNFALTDDTAPIVAEICRRLDGIPFAIELAAARVKVLSIPSLARRLDERFKILTGGSRTALPRQKTLTALIDWSYDLLAAQEKTFLDRAGIFAGSFGIDAALAVCADDGQDDVGILDLLSSLTDKSLVVADTKGAHERYRLLESTRAYALEKLTAAGDRERLARRHAEYFRDQASAADARYGTGSAFAWFDAVEMDLDNYRAAMEWALGQQHDPALGGTIAGSLGQLWFRGGLIAEGRRWIESALERVDAGEDPRVAARLWKALASLYSAKRMCEAAEKAVRLYEAAGDGVEASLSLSHVAWGLFQMGRIDDAYETGSRALAGLRAGGRDHYTANCLLRLGTFASARGAVSEGRDLLAQALVLFKALGNEMGAAGVLTNLGEREFADGHPDRALRATSEAQMTYRRRGTDALSIAIGQTNMVIYRIALGDLDGARESVREALRAARQAQDAFILSIALQHTALLAALAGKTDAAARLLGYVDAQFEALGYTREITERWGYEKLTAVLGEHRSQAEIERYSAEGAAWPEDRAVEEALTV